jgi:hypothetical protein
MDRTVTIARRFRGPDASGNGGYVAGLLAGMLDGPVEVTLRAPPPLETSLVLRAAEGEARLLHDAVELASARPGQAGVTAPPAPSLRAAEAAGARYPGFATHLYPECFVCGPRRPEGDGLRIFTGPMEDAAVVAGVWTPEPQDADAERRALPEIVWAALDCPSYFAFLNPALPALLGRMAADVSERPRAGEACIVVAWRIAQERRKHVAGSALYSRDGRLLAIAKATWIELARS